MTTYKNKWMKVLLVLATLLLGGLIYSHQKSVISLEKIVGNYIHTYKSGAIEEWQIKGDYTFVQNLYPDETSYRNKKPKYTLQGKWTIADGGSNVIEFGKMYIFDFSLKSDAPDEISPPKNELLMGTGYKAIWVSGGRTLLGRYQKSALILDDEMNYWFLKEP